MVCGKCAVISEDNNLYCVRCYKALKKINLPKGGLGVGFAHKDYKHRKKR